MSGRQAGHVKYATRQLVRTFRPKEIMAQKYSAGVFLRLAKATLELENRSQALQKCCEEQSCGGPSEVRLVKFFNHGNCTLFESFLVA